MDLSIIIVNYNNPELIEACLRSIDKHLRGLKKEIIVVDNNSKIQNLAVHIEHYPELRVIYLSDNMGFGFANNVGVKNATGSLLFLLNSDAEFLDNTFDLIYFDAFGPRVQGELWTIEIFTKMYKALKTGGVFVTYCAKGQVKRDLKSVGFTVEVLPGPPGKREMTRCRKA